MVVVIVDGKEYNLDEKVVAVMKYISEAEAMETGHNVNLVLLRLPSPILIRGLSNSFWRYSKHSTTTSTNLPKSRTTLLRITLGKNSQH